MKICTLNSVEEYYPVGEITTLDQRMDFFYSLKQLFRGIIQGDCWTPIVKPGNTLAYTSAITTQNKIRNTFVGFYCANDGKQYNLGVLFPYLPNGVVYPSEIIKQSRYRLQDFLYEKANLVAYNTNHDIHKPFYEPLKNIINILSILPGQTYIPNLCEPDQIAQFDNDFANQFQPAIKYIRNELGGTPLSWNQKHLLMAINRIVKKNHEDWVAAKMHPQPVPQFAGAQNYAAVAV